MTFFEFAPFVDDPVFIMYLFSFGILFRFSFLFADWLIDNMRWFWRRLRKDR